MEQFDKLVKDNTQFLDNPYIAGALTVFLIVYAGAVAPKLPDYVIKMFDYTAVKLVMFFLIVFLSRKNATVALVASIALMVSIMALNRLKFDQEMMSVVDNEQYSSRQLVLETCSCTCDCLDNIIPITDDGKLVVAEAKNAVASGALPVVKAEELVKNVVSTEEKGRPVLVAKTEEGAKRMEEITESVNKGKITEENAKKMSAVVVVAEAVMEAKAETKQSSPLPRVETESIGSNSMAEMAQEVLKRKAEETNRRGGVPLSSDELKHICASVMDDYKKTNTGCKDCTNSDESLSVGSVDPMSSSYASV